MEDRNGSFFWVGESNGQTLSPVKHRRKSKSKKLEFVGWGSRSLIEFLQSIGKDTGKQLSQYDVTAIINEYVHTYNLFNPMKKKRVVCDERLRSLFSKNSVPRNKIHELLNSHFAENNDSSEDDDDLYNSEEYEDGNVTYKKQKVSSSEKRAPSQKKKTPLSCFAAIIPENVKLLYLKRSLVQELVKHPESFEGKLLGSYIRIKSDPMDFSQKNSHQLHPVTGVKNVPGIGGVHEVLLEVPNMNKDIPIRMLSDDDFSKEEVEDLCQRVKDGLLKRPTVVEVEQKAHLLHEDITKHWLPRELAHLQNLIDRANEKGWRKELFEYLERKKQLQTPSEQSKLLAEVPTVTADALEPGATPQEQVADIEQPNTSPISIDSPDAAEDELVVVNGVDKGNAAPIKNSGSEEQLTSFQWVEAVQMPKNRSLGQIGDLSQVKNSGSGEHFQWVEAVQMPKNRSLGQIGDLSQVKNSGSGEHFQWVEAVHMPKNRSLGQTVDLSQVKNSGSGEHFQWVEAVQMPKNRSLGQTVDLSQVKNSGSGEDLQWVGAMQMPKTISVGQTVDLSKTKNSFGQTVDLSKTKNTGSGECVTSFQWVEAVQMPKTQSVGQTVDLIKMSNVIDLCDDVEETHDEQLGVTKTHEKEDEYEFSHRKWFYRDPQGQTQGPFSKFELKSWRDAGYFMPDFKVWKEGQTPEYAILLAAIL